MSAHRSAARTLGLALIGLFVTFAAFSPTLLFGRGSSAISLFLTSAGLLGVGLLLRARGGADARWTGTFLAVMGGVLAVLFGALAALLMVGAFRGY